MPNDDIQQSAVSDQTKPSITYQDIIERDIFSLIHADDFDLEKKANLFDKMANTIINRVIARVTDNIPEDKFEQWLTLVDGGDRQAMEIFLDACDIDLPKMLLAEAIIYKTELAENTNQIEE